MGSRHLKRDFGGFGFRRYRRGLPSFRGRQFADGLRLDLPVRERHLGFVLAFAGHFHVRAAHQRAFDVHVIL